MVKHEGADARHSTGFKHKEMLSSLNDDGYAVVSGLGWSGLNLSDTKAGFLSFCSQIAEPMLHNIGNPDSFVWDIKAVPKANSAVPTFSELLSEAELHTDNAFTQKPDDYFALYCVKPAACGGGESEILRLQSILSTLRASEAGREAEQVLRTRHFPFVMPTAFSSAGGDRFDVMNAPVLSSDTIRFRVDVIERAYQKDPSTMDESQRAALDAIKRIIDESADVKRFSLQEDELIIVNNTKVLHGRSAFRDENRHLLRIRLRKRLGEGQ